MSKTIALLSGKGGSGKTTLALSMATMLADCGIKVLLVDCDLSTNGATYFYEARLPDGRNKITSFYDVLFNRCRGNYQFIKISSNFDFAPSISQITKENTSTYSYQLEESFGWENFYSEVCTEYDVVLFDCQAGYTDILKTILPAIDIDLFVMEADAISSSAIRSLYLKIGDIINEKKIYQLFNKVTEEEYEIYSKLSGGTVFTNIDAIIFDWKIRKAFSIAQVPDMKNSSARYGNQIYDICNILFVDSNIQEHLKSFELVIKMHKTMDTEDYIQDRLDSVKKEREAIYKRRRKSLLNIFPVAIIPLSVFAFSLLIDNKSIKNIFAGSGTKIDPFLAITFSALIVSVIIMGYLHVLEITREQRSNSKELEMYQKRLRDIMEEKENIQTQLKKSKISFDAIEDDILDLI